MNANHNYTSRIVWTGNRGTGTSGYRDYDRTWQVATEGKPVIECSNDPLLGGDPFKPNPEDMLLSALAACHMLWFLHLASDKGIVVSSYEDEPMGVGEVLSSGAGRFVKAILRPRITIDSAEKQALADQVHAKIHEVCFIARSVAFPVAYEPIYQFSSDTDQAAGAANI